LVDAGIGATIGSALRLEIGADAVLVIPPCGLPKTTAQWQSLFVLLLKQANRLMNQVLGERNAWQAQATSPLTDF